MSMYEVVESTTPEQIIAGAYPAILMAIDGPTTGEFGDFLTFVFEGEGKRIFKGFATVPDVITQKCKLGRWLCALSGGQPSAIRVNPEDHIGKKYMLIYAENQTGKISLNTFSLIG